MDTNTTETLKRRLIRKYSLDIRNGKVQLTPPMNVREYVDNKIHYLSHSLNLSESDVITLLSLKYCVVV